MGESTRTKGGVPQVATSRLGFLARIIARFLGNAPELISNMQTAAYDEDAVRLERATVLLRTSAATVGADRLASLCAELRGSLSHPAARSQLIASIAEEHTRVAGILAGIIANGETSDAPQ